MANCEVKPELWINRFHKIKDQLAADNPSGIAQNIDQQARVIFMETIYGPDVKSITQEWKREKIISGPTYKVIPEGLTCLYAGKEIPLRKLAVDNVKEQTPQNFNSTEEKILLSAEKAILQAPTAEVVFPVYNKDGKIRYLSQWKRKDNFVETAMIDISQDGQDKTLEEAIILMEQMAEEKKGRIKTDLDKQVNLSIGLAEAVEIPVPMIQFIDTKVPLATALHSTVANDHDNSVVPVLSESVFLFSAVEPLFAFPLEFSPVLQNMQKEFYLEKTEKMPVVKQASMIQIIEENSETASDSTKPSSFNHDLVTWQPIFKKERAQVQETSLPIIQFIETKSAADKPFNLATVKNQFESAESNRPAVGYEAKEIEKVWQAKDAVAYPDCHSQGAVVAEKVVIGIAQAEQALTVSQPRMPEQQPLFERPVKELSLPLLEISSETAPVMVLRAELKPVFKADRVENFETETVVVVENEKVVDDEMILVDDQLSVVREKKAMVEVDQEETKLFLVENFSVTHDQAAKDQDVPPLRLKKMFWRIKAPESEPTEVSILELELPKDQNQRLYAFYHFLQKVVKKVAGQDAIRTRQIAVMAEKEDVNFDLELIGEIEYYLKLLRRKRNYAQAFAFVN